MAKGGGHTGWRLGLLPAILLPSSEDNQSILARATVRNVLVRVLGAASTFLAELVVARLLGAGSYGTYVYTLALVGVAGVFSRFGFDVAATRFVATYHEQQQFGLLRGFLRFSSQCVFWGSAAIAAMLLAALYFLRDRIDEELLTALALGAPLLVTLSVLQLEQGMLYGSRRVVHAELPLNVVRPLAVMLLAGVFSWAAIQANAGTALFWTLLATTGALAFSHLLVRNTLKGDIGNVTYAGQRRHWLKTSGAMVLTAAASIVLARTDIVMLGAMVSKAEVGQYGAALRLAGLLLFFLLAVNSILGPMVAGLHARKDNRQLQRLVSFASQSIFMASLLAAIALVVFGKYLLQLFGPEFATAYPVLVIMLAGQIVNAFAGPVVLLLNMTGHQGDAARTLILSAALNVLLNAVLIPRYGALGAAVAASVSMATWNVILSVVVWRRLRVMAFAFPFARVGARGL